MKYMNGNSVTKVGGNFKNNEQMSNFVKFFIKEKPDIYLRELKQKLEDEGIRSSLSLICQLIKVIILSIFGIWTNHILIRKPIKEILVTAKKVKLVKLIHTNYQTNHIPF